VSIAPPLPMLTAPVPLPPVRVAPRSVKMTLLVEKMRFVPGPPSIVRRFAPVPLMVKEPVLVIPALAITISEASVIVQTPVAALQLAAGMLKMIVSFVAEAFACVTASRKLPAPVSAVVVTV